jgi:hypothetical protein
LYSLIAIGTQTVSEDRGRRTMMAHAML